jgi:hypothetical protein
MRVTLSEKHDAGVELLEIAQHYKKLRPELDDRYALKLAMLSNPDLAETYLGCDVRRDAVDDVKKFMGIAQRKPFSTIYRR